MQRFDCLALNCPIFGPHILEASAGTGKTFSIEHVYVRLILESRDPPIEVEQILTVTFTRAATRELKTRIRSNLEKALFFLRTEDRRQAWPYLHPFFGSIEAIRALADAISAFDRCQIYTIHAFCYRMLKEFAFEAKMGFSLPNPEDRRIPEKLKRAVTDFLELGLKEEWICPEQCSILIKKYSSFEELSEQLLKLEKGEGVPFSQLLEQYKLTLQGWKDPIEEGKLLQDFLALQGGYKAKKGNFERQVSSLAKSFQNPLFLRELIKDQGTLFDFLAPTNRKVKAVSPSFLHYPGFFDWAREHLVHFIEQSPKQVMQLIRSMWNPIAEKILLEEEHLNPDEILLQMRKAIELPLFAKQVRQKYTVAIIDEFQDTDPVQWDIFRSLFLEGPALRAFYLVGDPKQSIYRFRKADVYTYIQARDFLGEEHLYHLDTNFRSSKKLIGALNAFFARDWLTLPKVNRTLPYIPVQAGREGFAELDDVKGALHFFLGEEELFLPFIYQEIRKLQASSFAILVKDRYQAEKALHFLKSRGISAIAKSHTPIGQTLAFQAIRELFEAILSPRDFSAAKILMAGPFGSLTTDFPLLEFKILLEEKGLVPFFRRVIDFQLEGQTLRERIVSFDLSFYRDVLQMFEHLFLWEKKEGFSFEGLKRQLLNLEELNAEEGGRRRMESDEDAVQIMTLHISKGLEFDVVFALGLASRTPETEEVEESNAEKLRQLYVAMTRAKRRLYVPMVLSNKEAKSGTHSPIELFCQTFEKPLLDQLKALGEKESITFEHLSSISDLAPPIKPAVVLPDLSKSHRPSFTPSFLSSFTSLAKPKEAKSQEVLPHILPRGAETGVIIHEIFERLFLSGIWKDEKAVAAAIAQELRFTSLNPWVETVQTMVQQTLLLPLPCDEAPFSLCDLEPNEIQVEAEFLFATPPDFVKGFIDLIFSHRGAYYFLDWKTNWLESYEKESLEESMRSHNYDLQAALYTEALRRHFGNHSKFGGAFYLFVRGPAAYHFYPNTKLIRESHVFG